MTVCGIQYPIYTYTEYNNIDRTIIKNKSRNIFCLCLCKWHARIFEYGFGHTTTATCIVCTRNSMWVSVLREHQSFTNTTHKTYEWLFILCDYICAHTDKTVQIKTAKRNTTHTRTQASWEKDAKKNEWENPRARLIKQKEMFFASCVRFECRRSCRRSWCSTIHTFGSCRQHSSQCLTTIMGGRVHDESIHSRVWVFPVLRWRHALCDNIILRMSRYTENDCRP